MPDNYDSYLEKMNSDFDHFENEMDEKYKELNTSLEFWSWFFHNNYVILPYTQGLHKRIAKITSWETDNLYDNSLKRHISLMNKFYDLCDKKKSEA